ncbi:MAG: hemerythrin domain-containing protein [Thermoplasmatota archaeon]
MVLHPTEELRQEHRAIEVMLKVMGAVAERLRRGGAVEQRDLERVVEFLQVFADRCHHGKEEELLFPALVEAGAPGESGPVGVMLEEHRLGRERIKSLAEAAEARGRGAADASSRIVESVNGYVGLLSEHIYKEENLLFPMADARLSDEKGRAILEGFERIERERIGGGRHEEFHRLLEELEERYL